MPSEPGSPIQLRVIHRTITTTAKLTAYDRMETVCFRSLWNARDCRSATAMEVIDALEQARRQHGLPTTIRVDQGSQFTSKGTRSMGLCERDHAGLQPPGQANRQCLRGKLQRHSSVGVPRPALVSGSGRCQQKG